MYHFYKSFQSLGIKSLVYQKIPKSNSFTCVCYCCYRAVIKTVLIFSTIVQAISVFGQLNWQLSSSFFLFVKTYILSVENIQPENSIFKCAYIAMISDIDTALTNSETLHIVYFTRFCFVSFGMVSVPTKHI